MNRLIRTAEANQDTVKRLADFVAANIGSPADVDVCESLCEAAVSTAVSRYAATDQEFDEETFYDMMADYIEDMFYERYFEAIFKSDSELNELYNSTGDDVFQALITKVRPILADNTAYGDDTPLGDHALAYGGDVVDVDAVETQVNAARD